METVYGPKILDLQRMDCKSLRLTTKRDFSNGTFEVLFPPAVVGFVLLCFADIRKAVVKCRVYLNIMYQGDVQEGVIDFP